MKNLFLFPLLVFLLLFYSCETRIEDNRRLVITGKIQDQNEVPLENINVISGDESFKLGSIRSDANGEFQLTSLSIDNGEFNDEDQFVSDRIRVININAIEGENDFGLTTSNDQYNKIELINSQAFRGVEINLGTITLNEVSQLTVNIDKGNFADQELTALIEVFSVSCVFELQEAVDAVELSCENLNAFTPGRNLSAGSNDESFELETLNGTSTVISIIDEADQTLFNQEFEINETNEVINISL